MPPNFESTDDPVVLGRLEHIMGLMRELRYVRARTAKDLAAEWGLEYQTVRLYTAEASRRVRAEFIDDDNEVGAAIGAALMRSIEGAARDARSANAATRNAARRTLIDAARTYAAITMPKPVARVEVTGKDGAPLRPTDDYDAILAELDGIATRLAPEARASNVASET